MHVRKSIWIALLAAGVLGSGSAIAVSDGGYDPKRQGCTPGAEGSDRPDYTEENCRAFVFKVNDRSHTYFSVGIPQEPDGTSPNTLIVCVDPGQGTKNCASVDRAGFHPMPPAPGTKRNLGALRVYFGADDNLFVGEHDGSEYINNGPSDGGAIQANATPLSAFGWLKRVLNDRKWLLTHPLPGADAGFGMCADGICISVQTARRVAYQGGDPNKHKDVANYEGKEWDPESCSGPSDEAEDCGGENMGEWHNKNGTYYAQPGIQIYEDPDPQASPLGSYPLPAIYVGTCGLTVGGGAVQAPNSPFTNGAGQLRINTGC